MSSPGQIIGGVVGAVAGFFLSGFNPMGALYGAQLGMMAGGAIDPPKGPTVEGPRLSDLTVQTSNYGAPIPRDYGTTLINGNVIWIENNRLKESVTKTKSGGKGGSKSKTTTNTYSYSATFAVGLCKGPIAGVRRIWIGPNLVYHAGATDPDTIVASSEASSGFAVYLGTNTQQPDPRIQADVGAANAPAWRGLAYLVFYDLELAGYGNSLAGAQVRVEVIQPIATETFSVTTTASSVASRMTEMAWRGESITGIGVNVVSSQYYIERLVATPSTAEVAISTTLLPGYGVGILPHMIRGNLALLVALTFYSGSSLAFFDDHGNEVGARIRMDSPFIGWAGSESPVAWDASSGRVMMLGSLGAGVSHYASASIDSGVWETLITYAAAPIKFYAIYGCADGQTYAKASGDLLYRIDADYNVLEGPWTYPTTRTFMDRKGSYFYFCDSLQTTIYEHYFDGSTYNLGSGVASVVGSFGLWCFVGDRSWWVRHAGVSVTFTSFSAAFSPRSYGLDAIVSSECLQSGVLTAGDIDVTGLSGKSVRGYMITRPGSIRSAIEPLQAVWPFDVQAHGYQIKFVLRGAASVATIPASDLNARPTGESSGVSLVTRREMDTQMPRRVVVKHFDIDREYNLGEQYAERLNTSATNVTSLELAIALSSAEAAGVAEVLLYLAWLERYSVSFVLPPSYGQLEVADVISLETPEGFVSLRLTSCNALSDQRIECEARYASSAVYTPTATGASSAVSGQTTIALKGITQAVLLDVPMVHEVQNGSGFPVAMAGVSGGWPGGSLYQSADSGVTWSDLADAGAPGAAIGTATNAIGVVESRMLDGCSVLNVAMPNGELYSVSLLNLLNGANTLAYGVHGRWEIIGAMTCTPSGGAYALTNLLRGRYGTEWAMGLHAVGDIVVLLDSADVQWLAMPSSAISQIRLYRAITFGNVIDTDVDRGFTYTAVNLMPLAPIALTGNRNPATNDWTLTWMRRTRSGGEWRDGLDADLGETSERYAVDVYSSAAYTSVKRTISTTSQSAGYSSAEQVADFGSNQATLYLKIYQLSDAVGRGYPLTASLTR